MCAVISIVELSKGLHAATMEMDYIINDIEVYKAPYKLKRRKKPSELDVATPTNDEDDEDDAAGRRGHDESSEEMIEIKSARLS